MVEIDPGVVVKLVVFSVVLLILPVGVLQASIHGYFDGETYFSEHSRKVVSTDEREDQRSGIKGCRHAIEGFMRGAVAISALFGTVTDNLRQLFGAVLAVLTVNAVVIAYVVSAYNERPTSAKLVKESKKDE